MSRGYTLIAFLLVSAAISDAAIDACQESTPAQNFADVLTQDFRTGSEPAVGWRPFGPQEMAKPGVGGLRISFRADGQKMEPVGLTTDVAIMGDFEVGMAYQMLALEKPKKGYGSGVNIWLKLRSKSGLFGS